MKNQKNFQFGKVGKCDEETEYFEKNAFILVNLKISLSKREGEFYAGGSGSHCLILPHSYSIYSSLQKLDYSYCL